MVRECLVRDWAVILTGLILEEIQFDQICLLHWLAVHGVFAIFPQVGHYIEQVENDSVCRGIWIPKRSHTNIAVTVGQLDELLFLFDSFCICVFAAPIRLHFLIGNPHFVLVVPSFAHFYNNYL